MNTKGKQILANTGIYALGTFGTNILSFFIVPLYTYYISTTDLGIYDIFMSSVSLLIPIITLQISDACYKYIIDDEIIEKEKYIRACIQVVLINSIIACALILTGSYICKFSYAFYFCIILINSIVIQTFQKILRGLKKIKIFSASGIIYSFILLSSTIIQLTIFNNGIEGIFKSIIAAGLIASAILLFWVKELRINIFVKSSWTLVASLYRYSIPLVPNYLNWWIMNTFNRYIVLFVLGSSANGIIAVAHKFPTVLQTMIGLFNNSWQDMTIASHDDDGKFYSLVFAKFYRIALSMMLWLIPFTKIFIFIVMSDSYKISSNYVPFYYLGSLFQGLSSFYGVGYLRNKKTNRAFITSVYGTIINVIINVLLIKIIGLQAVAVSTFIGFFVIWIIREKENRNELNIVVKWNELILLIASCIIVAIVSINCDILYNAVLMVVSSIVFCIYNRKDLVNIHGFLKTKLRRVIG